MVRYMTPNPYHDWPESDDELGMEEVQRQIEEQDLGIGDMQEILLDEL